MASESFLEPGEDRIRMLYVASQGHSGSTLLAQLLGRHSAVVSTGEIANLDNLEQKCTCNAPTIPECKFWQRVDEILARRGSRSIRELDIRGTDPSRFHEDNVALFAAVREASGASVIVDSSKVIDRLSALNKIPELDITPIYLRRHPAGVVNSNVRKGRNWLTYTLRHYGPSRERVEYFRKLDHVKVNYTELVATPEKVLTNVMRAVGLSFEQDQLLWAEGERHDVGGNRMRFSDDSKILLDDRWQRDLSPFKKLVINSLLSDRMIESDLVAKTSRIVKPIFGPNRAS